MTIAEMKCMRHDAWQVYSHASVHVTNQPEVAERALKACRDLDRLIVKAIERAVR